jgi:hypothetical protein
MNIRQMRVWLFTRMTGAGDQANATHGASMKAAGIGAASDGWIGKLPTAIQQIERSRIQERMLACALVGLNEGQRSQIELIDEGVLGPVIVSGLRAENFFSRHIENAESQLACPRCAP